MVKIPGVTEIGYWSELKLRILRDYAAAYLQTLTKQPSLRHVYIDAFAGAGVHISKKSHDLVPGSPLNALYVEPPFKELHLIDLDGEKVALLRELTKDHGTVQIYEGDANKILLDEVFPKVQYADYRRGLCLLDPYGLHLDWKVVETAGKMISVELFLNFPIMDINRNHLWRDFEAMESKDMARLTRFWGDESWKDAAYAEPAQQNLFGTAQPQKESNDSIAEKFRERLKSIAGFKFVPKPIPMRNSTGGTIYYLYFASNNQTGARIAQHILETYRDRGQN